MGYDLQMLKEPQFQICSGYWRTNGQGMSILCGIMDWLGVLDDKYGGPACDDIDFAAVGLSENDFYDLYDCLNDDGEIVDCDLNPSEAQLAVVRAYEEQRKAWRVARSPRRGKVPSYKFGGNDGCHVLPEECVAIADALGKLLAHPPKDMARSLGWQGDEESLLEWLEDWRDYNRVAGKHGGYRVS